jgi:hypothetical protein
MKNNNKPNIKITLTRELLDSLFTMLTYFEASEKDIGETYYSRNSIKLKLKILKHGKFSKSDSGENVVVYFFASEIIQLTDIFIKYINLRDTPDGRDFDYWNYANRLLVITLAGGYDNR